MPDDLVMVRGRCAVRANSARLINSALFQEATSEGQMGGPDERHWPIREYHDARPQRW